MYTTIYATLCVVSCQGLHVARVQLIFILHAQHTAVTTSKTDSVRIHGPLPRSTLYKAPHQSHTPAGHTAHRTGSSTVRTGQHSRRAVGHWWNKCAHSRSQHPRLPPLLACPPASSHHQLLACALGCTLGRLLHDAQARLRVLPSSARAARSQPVSTDKDPIDRHAADRGWCPSATGVKAVCKPGADAMSPHARG